MKPLFIFILLLSSKAVFAQETEDFHAPRYAKQAIGQSGVSVYLPQTEDLGIELSLSEDSSEVYTVDVEESGYHYAGIVVKLYGTTLESAEERESLLIDYMDFLMSTFNITEVVGYGKGHTLESNPDAVGVIDYWYDDEDVWAVKGWATKTHLVILMLYGADEYPSITSQSLFLNGVRFE
ncbi:MAG: hypothetical protein E6Q38_01625 [Crocinitomicaceae bacterium]|nr:MAG: hypothetical protein E6Q38_01625 [Crocinitomicaceae bacterium]